ncbi:MAG: phosphoribosylformylglycinamidine cyclo-ligase [Deltaproteobacteria bacterium]|nr:phosphoribosylformylglycinamidine cyclo-ligase [Deltaproteobacteria bacterium]
MTQRYQEAGVDIGLGNAFVERIKPLIRQTHTPGVVSDIGGFGGLFRLDTSACRKPVLVSSTDGVGTKLKIAQILNRHHTVGIDLVAMCVNDILVQGATPLFFLDYLATGKLDLDALTSIVAGIVEGCRQADCALIGGETAEMPGMYPPGEYDLAGFAVGLADEDRIIDGRGIQPGDQLVGLASNGLHSNGFSLVRKIFDRPADYEKYLPELGRTLGEELLRPTRIYVRPVLALLKKFPLQGLAHITGGGLLENIPRTLPGNCQAVIRLGSWTVPPIFPLLQAQGAVSQEEMWRVFNNGVGLVLVVSAAHLNPVLEELAALEEKPFHLGAIVDRPTAEPAVKMV